MKEEESQQIKLSTLLSKAVNQFEDGKEKNFADATLVEEEDTNILQI